MRKRMKWGLLILVMILLAGFGFFSKSNKTMQLSSSAFSNQGQIPSKYTCDAENVSPPLVVSHIPTGTKSLVLIVDDPDSPSGNWTHWLMWNISPSTTEIKEGQVSTGAVQGVNDFGKNEYSGPCPPSGTHRYQFKLYALNSTLDLSPNSQKKDLESAIKDHIIGQDLLIGLYQRH